MGRRRSISRAMRQSLGDTETDYTDIDAVKKEVAEARRLHQLHRLVEDPDRLAVMRQMLAAAVTAA